jgi:hypothetical protein
MGAFLISLIDSCKEKRVETWAYFRDVFLRLPWGLRPEQLRELLPDRWPRLHPEHRWTILEFLRQERHTVS